MCVPKGVGTRLLIGGGVRLVIALVVRLVIGVEVDFHLPFFGNIIVETDVRKPPVEVVLCRGQFLAVSLSLSLYIAQWRG